PAHGGRSLEFICAVCEGDGRFVLPKPCGARPESVMLPCAFQERFEVELRAPLLLNEAGGRGVFTFPFTPPFVREEKADGGREVFAFPLKEPFARAPLLNEAGGRFVESCDWRAPLEPCGPFVPRPKLPAALLPRLPEKLIACEGKREAPAAGV